MMSLQEATQLDSAGEGWITDMVGAAPVFSFWLDDSSDTADGGHCNIDMSCSAGTNTSAMAAGADIALAEEEASRRLKRKMSNRESARRSRGRKRRQAEELGVTLEALKDEKRAAVAKLDAAVWRVLAVSLDTARLRAEACALRRRLGEARICAAVLVEMSRLLGTSDSAVRGRARAPSAL